MSCIESIKKLPEMEFLQSATEKQIKNAEDLETTLMDKQRVKKFKAERKCKSLIMSRRVSK